ncbi:putative vinorine synthase-like [Capsicum annuum]|nr:putative vinorine synthase-like [Capsicum annuum]
MQEQINSLIRSAGILPPCPGDAVQTIKGLGPLDNYYTTEEELDPMCEAEDADDEEDDEFLFTDFDYNRSFFEVKEVELNLPLVDKESEQFRVIKDDHDDVFIAGFVMFYPCFSSFFEKPVFHMENFFLRECYKRKGFGKWLFSTMASEAARMGLSSVNWDASDWDESALEFYKQMGATISGGLRNLSLAGNALEAFDDDSN